MKDDWIKMVMADKVKCNLVLSEYYDMTIRTTHTFMTIGDYKVDKE